MESKLTQGKKVFIADNARILGSVTLGDDVSVWFGAVIRGDRDHISIGHRSNIQDNAVIHVDPGFPVRIGEGCIIGHLCIVHGAELGNNVLVGMNSTILNGAMVGDYTLIGANSLITSNTVIPPYSLVMGSPAKVVRTLNETEIEKINKNAESYVDLKDAYLASE